MSFIKISSHVICFFIPITKMNWILGWPTLVCQFTLQMLTKSKMSVGHLAILLLKCNLTHSSALKSICGALVLSFMNWLWLINQLKSKILDTEVEKFLLEEWTGSQKASNYKT